MRVLYNRPMAGLEVYLLDVLGGLLRYPKFSKGSLLCPGISSLIHESCGKWLSRGPSVTAQLGGNEERGAAPARRGAGHATEIMEKPI